MRNWQKSYLDFEKIYIPLKETEIIYNIKFSKENANEKGRGVLFPFWQQKN